MVDGLPMSLRFRATLHHDDGAQKPSLLRSGIRNAGCAYDRKEESSGRLGSTGGPPTKMAARRPFGDARPASAMEYQVRDEPKAYGCIALNVKLILQGVKRCTEQPTAQRKKRRAGGPLHFPSLVRSFWRCLSRQKIAQHAAGKKLDGVIRTPRPLPTPLA